MAIWASFGAAWVDGEIVSIGCEVGADSVQVISQRKPCPPATLHFHNIEHAFRYFELLQHSIPPITDEQFTELKRQLHEAIDTTKMLESRNEIWLNDKTDKRIKLIDSILFEWLRRRRTSNEQ